MSIDRDLSAVRLPTQVAIREVVATGFRGKIVMEMGNSDFEIVATGTGDGAVVAIEDGFRGGHCE